MFTARQRTCAQADRGLTVDSMLGETHCKQYCLVPLGAYRRIRQAHVLGDRAGEHVVVVCDEHDLTGRVGLRRTAADQHCSGGWCELTSERTQQSGLSAT